MSRHFNTHVALLLIALTALTGCHPTQPFYFHEDGDLSHYLDHATDIEYPDVCTTTLADAAESKDPLTVTNPEFDEMWDVTLEECIIITLQNSKAFRNLGAVTPFGFADALVGRSGQTTIYDPAITETAPSGRLRDINSGGQSTTISRVTASSAGGVEAALAEFDAQLSVTGEGAGGDGFGIYSRRDRPQNSTVNAARFFPGVEDQDLAAWRTQITKKSASGARFTIGNRTDYSRYNNGTQGFRALSNEWTTSLEARVDMPLLRGRGTMINRIPIVLARMNMDISLATFEASVRNLVLDVENTYWDLQNAYRTLETAKIGRDSAQVTWKIVYEKWKGDVSPIQDEAQAREQYFAFRSAVETALQQLYETETKLRYLMGLAATDGRLIRPTDEPTMARVDFDWRAIRTETLVRSPELRGQKWSVKQRELELVSAKNQLLPQLDVGVIYKWVGKGNALINANRNGLRFPQAGSAAFEELTGGDYQELSALLNFNLPIGFRSALAGVRNAQLQVAREKARLEDMELNTIHLLTTAIRSMDANFALTQTHFNRWSASEKEVESAEALYQGGKTTLDRVLDAQKRRADAQSAFYSALSEYNKSVAEVHFRKGSLLEYNNIHLAEGPWPQKAYWDALARARERDASYYLDYGCTAPGVVSRGPAPQGMADVPTEQPIPAEELPAPEPTPAAPTPAEPPEMLPDTVPAPGPAPITERPATPILNAPIVRTADASSTPARAENPLRKPTDPAFEWGALGMEAASENQSHRDSSVRPASFSSTISDAE